MLNLEEVREDTQDYFVAHPGDPEDLDRDNDGIACEDNQRRPVRSTSTPTSSTSRVQRIG